MRIFLKNFESKLPINILNYQKDNSDIFNISLEINQKKINLYFKSGRTKNFYSTDKISWIPLNKVIDLPSIALADQLFTVHVGFIPNQQGDDQEGSLVAKMPGKVVKVLKREGDAITKGEALLIIEAMKMENEIKANTSGIIEKIHVTAGQSINSGDSLASIQTTK